MIRQAIGLRELGKDGRYFFLCLRPNRFRGLWSGLKKLGFCGIRGDNLMAIEEEMEVFDDAQVVGNGGAIKLQKLFRRFENLLSIKHATRIFERTRMRCCAETSRSLLGTLEPSAAEAMRLGRRLSGIPVRVPPIVAEPIHLINCRLLSCVHR